MTIHDLHPAEFEANGLPRHLQIAGHERISVGYRIRPPRRGDHELTGCDLRIASESAFMVTSFGRLGLPGDFGGTWLLTQLVGPARARELYFTSRRVPASECERIGLVNRVVPDEDLESESMALARQLASGPPVAYRWMKDNLNRALESDLRTCLREEAERQCWAAETADFREATKAFVEKRPPEFRGH
jgi:enoyl-CoA hydratase/carnithine racemase